MDPRSNRNVSNGLPAGIYMAMAGLGALFALGAWGFADADYTNLVLVVVSGFIATAIAIPLILYLATRSNEPADPPTSLRDWIAGDFEASQDRVKSSRALVEILLPLAAVAFGIVAFAIVEHVEAHAVATFLVG